MRRFTALILAAFIILTMTACDEEGILNRTPEVQRPVYNDTVKPEKYISIGEEYEYYPARADGHFLCKVTDARIMTESECPPREMLDSDALIGKDKVYRYDEWFTQDGAYANGCRVILVDVTVENVDAKAWLASAEEPGLFEDPYAFYVYGAVMLADTSQLYVDEDTGKKSFVCSGNFNYFSLVGQYDGDGGSNGTGVVDYATQVQPGESVSFTIGFPVHANSDGTPKDLSALMLCVNSDAGVDTGVFIDMGLEVAS